MNSPTQNNKAVAIVGAGLVGQGWAIVFARARIDVRVYDHAPATLEKIEKLIENSLKDLHEYELIENPKEIAARITVIPDLSTAVSGVSYIQESVLEQTDVKKQLYAKLDQIIDADTVVGSSSSGIPSSAFTTGLSIAPRCLVAHPVNPPYLVPIVELVPSPVTTSQAMEFCYSLMESVGQKPIRVARELEGFILNRLQGVLLREAWALYEEGYCSVEDIDTTISQGLGLRWSFMGPFETIDLNAPGGVKDYASRLGELYRSIHAERLEARPWDEALIDRVDTERREILPIDQLETRTRWRDKRLMALSAHFKTQELS